MVNIIVVFPKLEDAKNIRNLLARNGYSVIGVCCTGAQVLQITDNLEDGIVICGYRFNDMMYADLRESLASSFQMLLVASMHISLPIPIKKEKGCNPHNFPSRSHSVTSMIFPVFSHPKISNSCKVRGISRSDNKLPSEYDPEVST